MARLDAAYVTCTDKVRREDPDWFFASLFWPVPVRAPAHAILAFAREVASIPERVSEPMAGEIRLQWWRDAIESGAGGGNPLAEALADTIARFNLDTAQLISLVEARAFDLYHDPMSSQAALEGYARATTSTIFDAIARLLAPGRLPPACVSAAGCAYARTNLLRGLPWQVMRGRLFLPLDVLDQFQLPTEHVLAHRNSPALGLVLNRLRAVVRSDLAAMRSGLPDAGAMALACLPARLCEPYLKAMEQPGLNPFETPIEIARWRRQWMLWRAARALPEPKAGPVRPNDM